MNHKNPGRLLAVAVGAILCAATQAQTTPYEATQRDGVGTGIGQQAVPRGATFAPRVEAAVQYASNITLAEDGEPQVDTAGIELAPGIYATYASDSFTGALDYALVGRAWEDQDFNDVSHRLDANAEWIALPDWFALQGDATYGDSVIDPRSGLNYGGLGIFGSGNMEETATASLSPILRHRFGDVELGADYRYGRVWYLDRGKGLDPTTPVTNRDSTDQSANFTLGTTSTAAKLYGTLFYNWQQSEYEDAVLPYEFERAGLDTGIQLSRTFALVGAVGLETDLEKRVAQGGLDAEFWSAGLHWTPNERTSAEVRYGDNSYGESWSFDAEHRARILEFKAGYGEQPTVETRELSLGDIFPGELPPGVPDIGLGIFNSLPYILRQGTASVRAVGSRTTLGLSGLWYERDYLASSRQGADETGIGAVFNATRELGSNLSGDFNLSYHEYQRNASTDFLTPSDDKDSQIVLRLNRTSGPKLTLSAESGYLQRTGDQDYDGWWVAMRARWTP